MYRIVSIIILFLFVPLASFAAELHRYEGGSAPLQQRVDWAMKSAGSGKAFWIGYSVQRLQYPNHTFLSGVSINGAFDTSKRPTLQEWIYGIRTPEPRDIKEAAKKELDRTASDRVKVWKEVGIFFKFDAGSKHLSRTQVMNLTINTRFDSPVYWLGQASHDESFDYVTQLYEHMAPNGKEDLMAAIGIHPPAKAFPFLKNILTSGEPADVQEAAAIFIGELETPETLELLKQVANTHQVDDVREAAIVGIAEMQSDQAIQTLYEVARSHQDKDLRETAIAMLADKQDGKVVKFLEELAWFDSDEDIRDTAVVMLAESEAGVPALLKIMEEHPSEETRETAVHMLAETVAGRKILKEKIKEDR